jgi:hypothetical protein
MMDEAEQWNNDQEGHRELTHVYLTKNETMESLSLYIYLSLSLSHQRVWTDGHFGAKNHWLTNPFIASAIGKAMGG